MKRFGAIFLSCTLLMITSACSVRSQDPDGDMRRWFRNGTGVALPSEARFIAGKDTSAWLGDIYLKLHVPPSFQQTLEDRLNRMTRVPSFALPGHMKAWPAWDMEGKDFVYYSKTTGDVDRGGFTSHLACERGTGMIYCHFVEYTP